MVDVKIDVGSSSPSVKGNPRGNKSRLGLCGLLYYVTCLAIAAGIAILSLDAYEYISWRPAKDARSTINKQLESAYKTISEFDSSVIEEQIGMKLVSTEQFRSLSDGLEETKKQLQQKETEVLSVTDERDQLKQQVAGLNGEKEMLTNKVSDLTRQNSNLKKQTNDITVERDGLKKQLEEAQKKAEEAEKKAEEAWMNEDGDEEEKKTERKLRG
jgi:chromosome segregation ATPase